MPRRMRFWAPIAFILAAIFAVGDQSAHAQDADKERGRRVFTVESTPPCGICHTLADAGTTGKLGPDLDERKLTAPQVAAAVRGGVGVMPAYGDTLSAEDITAVSAYVAHVAGQTK